MDHLWLERSFLLVTLLCSLTLGSGGDTRTMKKVSSLFCRSHRALIFGANNSSQAAKSQWQSLQLPSMFRLPCPLLRWLRIFLVFRPHGKSRITSKLYNLLLEISFPFRCDCITTDFYRLTWTCRSLVPACLSINSSLSTSIPILFCRFLIFYGAGLPKGKKYLSSITFW
jgi:hypothetical protein